MRKTIILAAMGLAVAASDAKAQVDLSAYADAQGFLDVQALTCAQLANTWQGDADRLTAWYSGWYNGLAKKHYMDITKGKEAEHEVIVYCKANPELRIIQAIEVVFKSMRERLRHRSEVGAEPSLGSVAWLILETAHDEPYEVR